MRRPEHEDKRLGAPEPERARRMVSESRDLVARTLEAVARSQTLLERLHRKRGRRPTPLKAPREGDA